MRLQQEIIEKILDEVDPDIKEIMLRTETIQQVPCKGYDLIPDASNTILSWQLLRDNKHGNKRTNN